MQRRISLIQGMFFLRAMGEQVDNLNILNLMEIHQKYPLEINKIIRATHETNEAFPLIPPQVVGTCSVWTQLFHILNRLLKRDITGIKFFLRLLKIFSESVFHRFLQEVSNIRIRNSIRQETMLLPCRYHRFLRAIKS